MSWSRVSLKFACGCTTRPSGPIESYLVVRVGMIRECRKHGEQVITRVTSRLVD